MLKWMWVLVPAIALAGPVYQPHDKWPEHRMHDEQSECNEHHNLKPDGDGDCDDKVVRGVPEDESSWASIALLGLSAGYILVRYRRRGA
jgi:hypothetical protein